jgi:hypothetical protein
MSTRIDTVLREALDDLAASAPVPAGLAPTALRRARRQRLIQWGGLGTAVAAAAAVVAVVASIGFADAPAHQAAGDDGRPTIIAYGMLGKSIDDLGQDDHSLLLDRTSGRYERVPYQRVVPSPDGDRALVWRRVATATDHLAAAEVGVLDRATGTVRWLPRDRYAGSGEWSRDGRKILLNQYSDTTAPAAIVADPDTLQTSRVVLAGLVEASSGVYAQIVWAPDGRGFATTVYGGQSGPIPTAIHVYGPDGRLARSVPATAALGPHSFSPDGRLMALSDGSVDTVVLADVGTGAEQARLKLPGEFLGWHGDRHLVTYAPTHGMRHDAPATLAVVDLTGTTTATYEVPHHLARDKILA